MNHKCWSVLLAAVLGLVASGCTRDVDAVDEPELGLESSGTVDPTVDASDLLLTAAEEKAVLREIDNICGDTWCEGDFDYAFHKLECRKSTHACIFKFDFLDHVYATGEEEEPKTTFRIPARCTFADIRSRDDVITTEGGRITYTDRLYDLVNACIGKHENAARRIAQKLERGLGG